MFGSGSRFGEECRVADQSLPSTMDDTESFLRRRRIERYHHTLETRNDHFILATLP